MIPFPIFIPFEYEADTLYYYPKIVVLLMALSIIVAIAGVVFVLIDVLIEFIFDKEIKETLFRIAFAMMFTGMIMILITLPVMLITGTRVE